MTRAARYGVALGLFACVAAGAWWGPALLMRRAAPGVQRPLLTRDAAVRGAAPGAPRPRQAAAASRVRVVVLDGLSRGDTERLPAFAAECARGLDVIVDVGFPTKSAPVQLALWTGLTAEQLGAPLVPDGAPPPAWSIPVRATGSVAVVEAYRAVAVAAGFAVDPPPEADSRSERAAPAAVRAWRDAGFVAAAARAIASDAPLVLVHVLGVDEAAHDHGRSGPAYDAALRRADAVVAAAVRAAPADALRILASDHGHLPRGGHGGAEDAVRRVRACLVPSPDGAAAASASRELHLVDLSRVIADALAIELDPRSVGRPLVAALGAPDPDATLPRPSATRWSIALALAALIIAAGAHRLGRAGWVWSWPLLAYATYRAAIGLPSLSAVPTVAAALATAAPWALVVAVALRRHGGAAIAIAAAAPAGMILLVFAILSRVPDAVIAGAAPRVPTWTAHLVWSGWVFGLAATVAAIGLVCPDHGQSGPAGAALTSQGSGQNQP